METYHKLHQNETQNETHKALKCLNLPMPDSRGYCEIIADMIDQQAKFHDRGELIRVSEQDVLLDHAIIMIKWPKEGTLKGKQALLWDVQIELMRSFPPATPTVAYFRHPNGLSGVRAGEPFGPNYLNKWVARACKKLGVARIGLYALGRYMLPEIGETMLV